MRPLDEIQKDVQLIQIWNSQARGPWGEAATKHSKATLDLQWDIIDIVAPLQILVKAAEETLASAMEAGQIQAGLCFSLLELKLALKPFQEDTTT